MSAGEPSAGPVLVCSSRGCRLRAEYGVVWNNPRLHRPGRRKVWLACSEHRESLSAFVSLRGFLIEVVPVGELGPEDG